MSVYSIIQKSHLEGTNRLDAEYYQPEYLEIVRNLTRLRAIPMKEIAINSKRKFTPKVGEPFHYIEISEVDLTTGEYNKAEILGENAPDRAQWIVEKNDVIVSTVRPIRNAVSLINEDVVDLVCSSGFAVLESMKIEPEYLFVYLKSEPIVKLLDRLTTATMYPAVTTEDVLNTKIYLGNEIFRQEIKNRVIQAQKELRQSKLLYAQAEDLLLQELGLKDYKSQEDLTYNVNLSEIKLANRMDAEYFQPKHIALISKIKKSKSVNLLELSETCSIRRGDFIDPRYYVARSRRAYIRIKELPIKGDINMADIAYIDDDFSSKNLETLLEGDLIFAGIGATLGKTARIPKELEESFYSNNTARFRIRSNYKDKIDTYYLQVVLQSTICQKQFEQRQAQTAQAKIADEELKTVLIPILPKATQQKIADLVRKSHEARKKAKELLEEAKQRVEEIISGEAKKKNPDAF